MNPNSVYRPDIDGLRAVAALAVVLRYVFGLLIIKGMISAPKGNKFFVDLCTND